MFYDLKSLLPKFVKRSGLAGQIETNRIIEVFNEIKERILGPELARKVRPLYLKNKVLLVASLSDEAVGQLQSREEEMIGKINKKFGPETIKKIKYIT